jgi:sulfur carrier protein ThiS
LGAGVITVGDKVFPWWEGLTLADIVRELDLPADYAYASLDGKLIWKKDWAITTVPDGAKIRFRGIIAGG